jgi:hypothetical protein
MVSQCLLMVAHLVLIFQTCYQTDFVLLHVITEMSGTMLKHTVKILISIFRKWFSPLANPQESHLLMCFVVNNHFNLTKSPQAYTTEKAQKAHTMNNWKCSSTTNTAHGSVANSPWFLQILSLWVKNLKKGVNK